MVLVLAALVFRAANAFSSPIIIAIMDDEVGTAHQRQIAKVIEDSVQDCKSVNIVNYPIFKNGKMTKVTMTNAINKILSDGVNIVNLSWNDKISASLKDVLPQLKALSEQTTLVMAAGENKKDLKQPLSIDQTVAGLLPKAIVVAEADDFGRVAPQSNYGPEIDRVIAPPSGLKGSSFSVAKLVGQLACERERYPVQF